MKLLIGDIGNTVTKVSIIDVKRYKSIKNFYFDSNKIVNQNFLKKNFKINNNKKIFNLYALFSSVVPKYKNKLKSYLIKNYNIKLIEIMNKKIKKNIIINIKNRKQVGSDRIANAVGAYTQ